MRFWMSWYQHTEDERPLNFPPNPALLGWWCSGYSFASSAEVATPVLCALVEAESLEDAWEAVSIDWPPEERELRFAQERPEGWLPGDRFPLSDWMLERVE